MNRTYLAVAAAAGLLILVIVAVFALRGGEREMSDEAIAERMAAAESAYADADYERVAEILREIAEAGAPLAQYRLGMMHREGLGVPQDREQAIVWLQRADGNGLRDARSALIQIYLAEAQDASPEDSIDWYERAADLESTEARAVLGSYYLTGTIVPASPQRAIPYLRAAAEAGDARAATNLGYAYLRGVGVAQSDAEAFRWYSQAGEAGLVRAQPVLGLLYETGRGTEADTMEAVRWYLNAWEAGAAGVDVRLGGLLARDEIDAQDPVEGAGWVAAAARSGDEMALSWLETEAEAGSPGALAALAELYAEGEAVPQNDTRALDYEQRAADAGVAAAQLALAGRYAAGRGVEQDYVRAHVWANLAAAGGAEGAASERDTIRQFLSADELAEAQAEATRWREARRGE